MLSKILFSADRPHEKLGLSRRTPVRGCSLSVRKELPTEHFTERCELVCHPLSTSG